MMNLGEIARRLNLELVGDPQKQINSIAPLAKADATQISFLAQAKFLKELGETLAGALIVKPEHQAQCPAGSAILLSDNPYLSFAQLTALFDLAPKVTSGIHPKAIIDETATVAATANIAANVVVGAYAIIGEHVVIEANSVVSDFCVIGDYGHLHANVTIYHRVHIGTHVNIHSGAIIGSDGFGFAPNADKSWQKIHQLGSVIIGNHVDIGANACIDRGALEDTLIADGVIIDNLVHVAHNCSIGNNTAIAACVAMAGSTSIGKNCTFGGGVGIAGHIEIGDNIYITGMSIVTGNLREAGVYSSGTALMPNKDWRKSAVRFTQLDAMHDRIKKLEKQ